MSLFYANEISKFCHHTRFNQLAKFSNMNNVEIYDLSKCLKCVEHDCWKKCALRLHTNGFRLFFNGL